jgi:hypothetical protein
VIVFDVSRLLTCAARVTPTGIDRVEFAYARHLIAGTTALRFARIIFGGRLVLVPQPAVKRYLDALAALWRDGSSMRVRGRVRWAVLRLRLAGWW